ncbi:hypothetical protein T01_8784 [Trichinella spiralis]|uniref:Uncharacterized protein n=1 Tax=Trichinella spiralis TaxID=6334 RepID=A0A0V1AKV8_TRISP|nr:hypothetical protein T01_8784 [Trichinella spiralis]
MINHNAIDRSPKSHTTNNCYVPPHCRTLPDRQVQICLQRRHHLAETVARELR